MAVPLRLDGLLAEVEITYGTDPTPVAADDGVRVSERIWSSITIEHAFLNKRESASGSILPIAPAARTGRVATLEIAWDMRGAGVAYALTDLPEADPLLRACGLARTDDFTPGTENVIYNQADSGMDSCTIYAYAGTKLIQVVGCRGNMRWPVEAGAFGILRFSMQGMVSSAPTEVALPAITYDAAIPPTAVGMALAVGGWSPDVVSAEFDQGAVLARLPGVNAADGIVSFEIAGAEPTYKLSAKLDTIANYDPWANMAASTGNTITQTLGSVQYNRASFDVTTDAYLETISNADQDSFAGVDLTYSLASWGLTFD